MYYFYLAPPSPPINLKVKESTSRTATLTWEPPENNGGTEITGYVVEKKLEYMPSWEKVFTLEAFTLDYTFENLKEKSDYLFRVFAENSVGLSPPAVSEVVQMRTHASKYAFLVYLADCFILSKLYSILRILTMSSNLTGMSNLFI